MCAFSLSYSVFLFFLFKKKRKILINIFRGILLHLKRLKFILKSNKKDVERCILPITLLISAKYCFCFRIDLALKSVIFSLKMFYTSKINLKYNLKMSKKEIYVNAVHWRPFYDLEISFRSILVDFLIN